MAYPDHPPRSSRRWPLFVGPAAFLLAALGWTAFWFYAASEADVRFEEWRTREAKSGRVYECADRSFGGFPFRFELRCGSVSASFIAQSPLTLRGAGIVVVAQVYTPDLLIAEFQGPLTIAEGTQPPSWSANWKLATSSVRGVPNVPQRISMVWDEPVVSSVRGTVQTPMFRAQHAELHARFAEGTPSNNPVIEVATQLAVATAEGVHPLLAQPFDTRSNMALRGLRDIAPKPWPARFREIQAAGGRIEVKEARFQQGETIAVGSGELGLSPAGRLDGELKMIVTNMEAVIPSLGLDQLFSQGVQQSAVDRIAPGVKADDVNKVIGALDRLMPGLGNIARKQANAGVSAGLAMLGEKTTLEGKPAHAFPLRFVDGAIYFGPVQVAQTPSLF